MRSLKPAGLAALLLVLTATAGQPAHAQVAGDLHCFPSARVDAYAGDEVVYADEIDTPIGEPPTVEQYVVPDDLDLAEVRERAYRERPTGNIVELPIPRYAPRYEDVAVYDRYGRFKRFRSPYDLPSYDDAYVRPRARVLRISPQEYRLNAEREARRAAKGCNPFITYLGTR